MHCVVLDTNILVSALWTPGGKAAQIIALMPSGKIIPCYSYQILREYRAVLNRPKLKFSGSLTQEILADIEGRGLLVAPETSKIHLCSTHTQGDIFISIKTASNVLLPGEHASNPKLIISPPCIR